MNKLEVEKDVVIKRMDGIQGEVAELRTLAQIPFEEFQTGVGVKLAHYHLHRALEGVFHIATHILSRIPGAEAVEYKEIARKLGEHGIVEKTFADKQLVEMAKYRNRLVHFYAEINAEEIYKILQNDLGDFDTFLAGVKNILE